MTTCFACFKSQNKARDIKLVIIGLDNAGKTTTVACLQGEPPDGITPTIGFANATLKMGKWNVTLYDLGGGSGVRDVWQKYYADVYGIIFVVDSVDVERLDESKDVLSVIFADERVKGKPIIVFANKQDKENAQNEKQITEHLGLPELSKQHDFLYNVLPCSALKGFGNSTDKSIKTGINWLLSTIEKNYTSIYEKVEKESAVQKQKEAKERKERMERIKKLREEREKAAKEAGVEEEEEESEEDDVVTGNPFRNIKDQIGVTEKREKKAKENAKKIEAYQQQKLQESQVSGEEGHHEEEHKNKLTAEESGNEEEEGEEVEEEEIVTPKKQKKRNRRFKKQRDKTKLPEITVQSATPRAETSSKKIKKGANVTSTYEKEDGKHNYDETDSENCKQNDIKVKSKTRVITVNSLDNMRTQDDEPAQGRHKNKSSINDSDDTNDDYSECEREYVENRTHPPKQTQKKRQNKKYLYNNDEYLGDDDRAKSNEGHREKENKNIHDSHAELFRAKSYDSLQGSNVEINTRKIKKKKKKKKKIIVVEVDEDEEYYERTIKKMKRRGNKTVPTPCREKENLHEMNGSAKTRPLPVLNDSGHMSKLEPIKLRGRLPDLDRMEDSKLPSWARGKTSYNTEIFY